MSLKNACAVLSRRVLFVAALLQQIQLIQYLMSFHSVVLLLFEEWFLDFDVLNSTAIFNLICKTVGIIRVQVYLKWQVIKSLPTALFLMKFTVA